MNATPTPENQSAQWEQDLIKRFAFEALQEQRRARRWSIFFKLLLLMYLGTRVTALRLSMKCNL